MIGVDAGTIARHKRYQPRPGRCMGCGKTFVKRAGHHLYCSEECKLYKRNGLQVCPICDKRFVPKKQSSTFCSRECYRESVRSGRSG
jgi:hypothetical protein